ncbi:hypothetical protein C6382_10980 [Pseudomonas sp. BBP2017]|nr:hypothetical protein C6382_10980 [Pseudomonas sp. BBP2017]
MGPLNWIIAALGVLYLITWYFQQTPMQKFLSSCCWSKPRAGNLAPIAAEAQQAELNHLYGILYTPRVSMQSRLEMGRNPGPLGLGAASAIDSLTIDLPGAEPGSAYLKLSLMGDPWDSQLSLHLFRHRPPDEYQEPRPWRNMTPHWLPSSTCSWIPFKEGQGLRLSGPFNIEPGVLGTKPRTVSLRLWYRTPLTALLGAKTFIGGERGVAFTLSGNDGVVALRDDPTPELDRVPVYVLDAKQAGAYYLQPKDKT